ncbi:MAG: outer membrane beta-barrel protein [Candidatus Omnitrophica bacterium]|nr:outer membrane beta-barrel protein [Candidatus Omnitrophota bacterium]MDE2223292.1 outer membrane beta-barrel protein [Candidatus Omnitrophota bacterium]
MKKLTLVLISGFITTSVGFGQQVVSQTKETTPTSTRETTTTTTMYEYDHPLQISVQGGGLWAQRDDRLSNETGWEVTGRISYDLTPNFALGVEGGGLMFVDKSDGTRFGRLYGVPAMVDVIFKLPLGFTGNRLVPYVFGAGGAVWWNYSKSGYSDTTGVSAKDRWHWAVKPGAGLEYYLNPHLAVFVEGSYLFSERFDLKGAAVSPPNGKLKLDSMYGGGGIKIAF